MITTHSNKLALSKYWNLFMQIRALFRINAMRIVKQIGGEALSIGKQSIDLNVSGTIKLDAGNGNTAMLDASKLLNDQRFISKIAELVSDAANRNVNAGKVVRSTSSKKGMYTPSSNRWGGVNQT